jgi:outer membrane immunogenic protein
MQRWAIIGAIATLGGIGGVFAAELPARTYAKAPVATAVVTYNWTGCYVGANVGGGRAHTHQEFPPPFAPALFSESRGSSVVGGVQIGCDYQFDRFVIGAQGQLDFARIESSQIEPLFPTDTSHAQTRHIFTATARAGYLVLPSVLVYAKGGGAWTQTYLSVIGSVPITFLSESVTSNRSGWTVGGGAEWMFAPGWSAFAEYNYMDFGTKLTQYVAGPNTRGAPNALNVKLTTQTALGGVNYKFNWGGPVVAKY